MSTILHPLTPPLALSSSSIYGITPRTCSPTRTITPGSSRSNKHADKKGTARGPHNAALVAVVPDPVLSQAEFADRNILYLTHLYDSLPTSAFPEPEKKSTRKGPINPGYDIVISRDVLVAFWNRIGNPTNNASTAAEEVKLGVKSISGVEGFNTLFIAALNGLEETNDEVDDDMGKVFLQELVKGAGAKIGREVDNGGATAVAFEFASLRWLVRYPSLTSLGISSTTNTNAVNAKMDGGKMWVRKHRKRAGERRDEDENLAWEVAKMGLGERHVTDMVKEKETGHMDKSNRVRADSTCSDRSDTSGVSSGAVSYVDDEHNVHQHHRYHNKHRHHDHHHQKGTTQHHHHTPTTTTTTASDGKVPFPFDTPTNRIPVPTLGVVRAKLTPGMFDDSDTEEDETKMFESVVATRDLLVRRAGEHQDRVLKLAGLVKKIHEAGQRVAGSARREGVIHGQRVKVGGVKAEVFPLE